MGILYEKKSLSCPVCGNRRLIDAPIFTESEMVPEDKIPIGWLPDYYQKCRRCKSEIGIRKVS